MYLLYNLLLPLAALILLPWDLIKGVLRGRARRGLRERCGFYAADRLAPLQGKQVIWLHAVSVGETRAAIPLIKALKQRYPHSALVLTNVTETGHEVAEGIAQVDLCLYFPYDFAWVMRRAFRQLAPTLVAIVETEIWPNLLRVAGRQGIPVVLVNGRISDRSFPRYRRLGSLLRPVLAQFSAFCMQSALDAERIRALGAPAERVSVTHNLKFDMQTDGLDKSDGPRLRLNFGLPSQSRVLVAGSTHPGEEEQLVEVYQRLLQDGHDLVLVLVPRHPERCRAVGDLLTAKKLPFVKRSAVEEGKTRLASGAVLLVDSVGELLKFYATADLVFVGGSLVPVGGHNILEAALLSKPVMFGPQMHNFKEIARLLSKAGGGMSVADAEELYRVAGRLLNDPAEGRAMGARGYELLSENAGATARTLAVIEQALGSR